MFGLLPHNSDFRETKVKKFIHNYLMHIKLMCFRNIKFSDDIKSWGLGNGESSVLAVALQHQEWVAVLDDGAARKCANVYNLNLTGTLGVLLIAYKTGIIPNLQEAIDAVKQAGLHLDNNVIQDILRQARA